MKTVGMFFLCFCVLSCGENSTPPSDPPNPIPIETSKELSMGEGTLWGAKKIAQATHQIITQKNGWSYALIKSTRSDLKNARKIEATLAASNNDFKSSKKVSLGAADRISDLMRLSENRFIFALINSRQRDSGQVIIDIQIGWIAAEGSGLKVSYEQKKQVEINNSTYHSGEFIGEAEGLELRKQLAELYQSYYFRSGVGDEPKLFKDRSNRLSLYVSHGIESGWVELSTMQFHELKPFDSRLSLGPDSLMCATDDSQKKFVVFSGKLETLRPILLRHGIEALQKKNTRAHRKLIVNLSNGKLTKYFELIDDEHESRDVNQCLWQGNHLYLVGSRKSARREAQREVWIQKLGTQGLTEFHTTVRQNGFASAIAVDDETEKIFVGGSDNFTQFDSGSITHLSGFVLQLRPDLKREKIFTLAGERSTRIRSLIAAQGKIVIGGSTDGPDTHSKDRSSKAFVVSGLFKTKNVGGN